MVKKIVDALVKVQLVAAILCLVTFVVAVVLQVATRYIPGFSWLWTEQIANYTFISSVLMGAAVGVRHKEHFFLSVLPERLTGKQARLNNILIQILSGLFGLFLLDRLDLHFLLLCFTACHDNLLSKEHGSVKVRYCSCKRSPVNLRPFFTCTYSIAENVEMSIGNFETTIAGEVQVAANGKEPHTRVYIYNDKTNVLILDRLVVQIWTRDIGVE